MKKRNKREGKMEKKTKGRIHSLSDRLRELEEGMKDDDITFLQNYNSLMNRTKYTLPDAELNSETLIDLPKHLCNLKYQVWEKMKNICPYYVSVSYDLTSVISCFRRQNKPNPLHLHRNRMVLGSVGYGDGVHTWEIEVGNSRQWTLGVCFGLEGKPIMQPLTPENGFWGLRRDGDSYRLLATGMSRLNISVNPEVVRVKLECYDEDSWKKKRWRKVSFSDASSDYLIAQFIRVPLEEDLFPFVMPEKRSVPLHAVPANVILTVEQKLSFMERHLV